MKVLTVGGATVDTIAIIDSHRIERMTMLNADSSFLLLEEGRKTEALEISTHAGGGGVNTAVAMARLGLDVAALVKLGRDERAETVLARLMQEGVSTRWVVRDGRAPTGASVLISSHDRNAAVFTFRGANTLLEPQDLRPEAFAVDLVYIASLSSESADRFPEIIAAASQSGAHIATNPGIRQLSARGGALIDCLSHVDVMSVNRIEAEALVPRLVARFGEGRQPLGSGRGEALPALAERGLAGGGFEIGLADFFKGLARLGCDRVLLTDGKAGAYAGADGEVLFCSAIETEVAGTAGAGDAFSSTFAALAVDGVSTDKALIAATVNAAAVVGHVDTQTGLLDRPRLEQRIAEVGDRLPVRRWAL